MAASRRRRGGGGRGPSEAERRRYEGGRKEGEKVLQTTSQAAAAVGQISLLAQHTNEFGCRALRTCYRHRIRIRLRGEIGTRLIVNHFLAHSHSSPAARSVSNPRSVGARKRERATVMACFRGIIAKFCNAAAAAAE